LRSSRLIAQSKRISRLLIIEIFTKIQNLATSKRLLEKYLLS